MNINKKDVYQADEVHYENKTAGVQLSGTLMVPKGAGPYPAVILISGMGPVDRDGTTFNGHKPLFVLADHLARQGIAVLRFDKRGAGTSTGKFDSSVTCRDLADDVRAGIEYLKTRADINPHSIGLIGHSEGGFIATLLAAESPGSQDIAWVVLMAGAVLNTTEGLIKQVAVQLRADGASEDMIAHDSALRRQILDAVRLQKSPDETEQQLRTIFARYWADLPDNLKEASANLLFAFLQKKIDGQIAFMNSPYYRFMITYDSSKALAQIKVPLLAIYGERDFMAPHIMLPYINKAMERAGNTDYALLELPKLNHSFQTCKTGAIAEYATLEEAIAPSALHVMSDWIVKHIK